MIIFYLTFEAELLVLFPPTPDPLFLCADQLNPNSLSGWQCDLLKTLTFPHFSEAWVGHTVLANETPAEGSWEKVCPPDT